MGMPLDLYVIRHGESEANVIISAGEQGDNSLYTQDNVTVPDRSWRLTATGRKQADCIGRWLVAQQPLFDRYLVSPYVRTRDDGGHDGPAESEMGGDSRAARTLLG